MRVRGIAIALAAYCAAVSGEFVCAQQSQMPADSLSMTAAGAAVWSEEQVSVSELHGPIHIELDHTRLSADNAVVWINPQSGGLLNEHRVEIALIGHAQLRQDEIVRLDQNLLVTVVVRGDIRLVGPRDAAEDRSSDLYKTAAALRAGRSPGASMPIAGTLPQRRWSQTPLRRMSPSGPTGPATTRPTRMIDVDITTFDKEYTADGNLAAVVSGGTTLRYRDDKNNLTEFVADNLVLFTNLKNLQGLNQAKDAKRFIADHILAAYFEGDVQVYATPADSARNELRMRAERVYYDFGTDRAILTDVVFHTVDIKRQIPIFVRASSMRQLSQGEFNTKDVELTTSAFATPTYSLAAQKAYVRAEPAGNPELGEQVSFSAQNAVLKAFGVPVFYLPFFGGTMTSRGTALRGLSVEDGSDFGVGARTEWGLFESLGKPAPKDLDASYRLDYFGKRGPGFGADAKYEGGFITETTKDPWNFLGDLHAYFVDDHGIDDLGGARAPITPLDELRGRAYLEHQHFFPDDWQAQLRLGYLSDANFLTQWFPDEFRNNLPLDESVYLKHQHESEVYTLLAQWQPNDLVTSSDFVQEQREVEHLPEIGYHRVGDSFADDNLTFFSDNTAAGLKFSRSSASLPQQGYYAGLNPGLPSYAYTGDPGDTTWRGDFREEVDWPINAGRFKIVPYVFGRYTVYTQGVAPGPASTVRSIPTLIADTSDRNRVMAGAGVKLSTAFWRVDDSVESDLFDIHRLRHVIEPEVDLFTSAQTLDQDKLFIYDENVDAINDVQAVQLALRQRWQTKRGGPGRWRSVDVFTLNVYGDFFANQPDARFRDPVDFRGLYFSSLPEASLPRNSINADAQWRISDTTALLMDASENVDRTKFATGSIGLAVQRDERLTYFIGNRYIADLDSNITTVEATYELSRKYTITASQSFDFGQSKSVYYSATLTRKFDRFSAALRVYFDQTSNSKGFSFDLIPDGLGRGVASDQLNRPGY